MRPFQVRLSRSHPLWDAHGLLGNCTGLVDWADSLESLEPAGVEKAMTEHNPQFQYDCAHCKFNWCCGPTCSCGLKRLPPPPEHTKRKVDAALVQIGLSPQFYGKNAQRR
jgi:hypothetical protein